MDDQVCRLMADVPKTYADRFTALVGLTDAFCDAHLNDEYRHMCREMAAAVCQKDSPVLKGKPDGWAAGIVYALGRVNFLDDPPDAAHEVNGDRRRLSRLDGHDAGQGEGHSRGVGAHAAASGLVSTQSGG
jgi:hypothetical protein